MGDMTDVFNGVVNITGNLLCRCGTGAYCCTYNGNAGEIHDADCSFGNRCCVCGNRIFDL